MKVLKNTVFPVFYLIIAYLLRKKKVLGEFLLLIPGFTELGQD